MKPEKTPPMVLPDPLYTIEGKGSLVPSVAAVMPLTDPRIESPRLGDEAKCERVWLSDLYARPELLIPPPTLFEGIAYKGRHTLFSGREKLGKSEVLGLICARAEGDAPICYFSFEEATGDLVCRMKRYGADPNRIIVIENINSVADIRLHVDEVHPDLIVIDSLSSLLKQQLGVTASENSDEWGTWVEHLTHISHDADVGLVTSHHANRESGTYRGHSSIAQAVDLKAEMFMGKNSDHDRRFKVIGRVRGVSVPKLRWTGSVYALESDHEDDSIRADVRNVLRSSPGSSMNQIKKEIHRRDKDVSRVVNQMHAEDLLIDLNDNPTNRAFVGADEGARFPQTDVRS